MPDKPADIEVNFYDDETKDCYIYRAKLFKSFLETHFIKYEWGFYASQSYVFFRIFAKDIGQAQRWHIENYIDEYEDVGYEADDEIDKPDVKRIFIEAYLNDEIYI